MTMNPALYEFFGYMVGPKAENSELLKKLITEALDDHLYWRKNFYPEDRPAITAVDQSSEGYQQFEDKIRDGLFEFLSEAKKGIPFFSPRYIGHMNTDVLLPSLVGYFAAMLYNQNNVAGESSPVSAKLEAEAIDMMARMVGYRDGKVFGYLSSGGTTANFYGLWVARNVRTLPVSLRMAVDRGVSEGVAESFSAALRASAHPDLAGSAKGLLKGATESLGRLVLTTAIPGERNSLSALNAWQLLNLPIAEATRIRELSTSQFVQELGIPTDVARMAFDELAGAHSLRQLGDNEFRRRAVRSFSGSDSDVFNRSWRVLVPANGHYSWRKAMDLLGLGQEGLITINHGPAYDMDLSDLEREIRRAAKACDWTLALASIFGTTEEGSIDDLLGVRDLLGHLQQELGLTVWWHVDAAYGGYLPTIMRSSLDDNEFVRSGSVDEPGTLKSWLLDCCLAVEPDRNLAVQLIEMSEAGDGTWLSWEELLRRTSGLAFSDSITLDPHKLGYVPYPAGAVLLRDGNGRHQVGSDAPYLWADSTDPSGFVGRFTLEGSRPGAAAVACWMAHRMVTLDQGGHGRLIALSILGTRRLYLALQQRFEGRTEGARLGVVHQPHTNMLCYLPYASDAADTQSIAQLTKAVQGRLAPTNEVRPFMAVETTVHLSASSPAPQAFDEGQDLSRILHSQEGGVDLPVIRSVVMGPYAVSATIRQSTRGPSRPVFDCFAEYLDRQIEEADAQIRSDLFRTAAERWARPMNAMVMDDDETVSDQLRNLIPELRAPAIDRTWQSFTNEDKAIQNISDRSRPLDLLFLDIDMRGSAADPKGTADGGYRALRSALERNRMVTDVDLSVKLIVFFTMSESAIHQERVASIKEEFPDTTIQTETLDKKLFPIGGPNSEVAVDERRRELLNTVRRLTRQIGSLPVPMGERV